ncbi:MAG: hypothetical protein ACR2LL_09715 [Nitrosopumilus sp.]
MGISCGGICHRYRATKPRNSGRYISGQKRCNVCSIFIEWKGIHCTCCGMSLRTRPRTKLYKAKLRTLQTNK